MPAAPVDMFYACFYASTEILTEPEFVPHDDASGAQAHYIAEVTVGPWKNHGTPLKLRINAPVEGVSLPYHKGDLVDLVYNHGTAYILSQRCDIVENDGHTLYAPRTGKDVRLGAGSGEWEALALHSQLAAEVVNLKAQIDALALYLSTATNGGGAVAPAAKTTVDSATLPAGIVGGDPASRAMGRKA